MKKPPPSALVIDVGAEKPGGEDAEMADSYGEESKEAAQSLLDAIKAGDADGVVEAFRSLKAVC